MRTSTPVQMVTRVQRLVLCLPTSGPWATAEIVKTSYGYHIMYFSGVGNTVYWKTFAEDLLRAASDSLKL